MSDDLSDGVLDCQRVKRPIVERWCECCGSVALVNDAIDHSFCVIQDCGSCQHPGCRCCGGAKAELN